MTVDLNPPPALPSPSAGPAVPESAAPKGTRVPNAEKDQPSDENDVDLIGDVTSWPSLSESTRPSPKLSPAPPSDPPIAAPQAPVISHLPQNNSHPDTNFNPNPNPNRQRPLGRGGSTRGGSTHVGFLRHPPPPPQPLHPPPPMPPAFYYEGHMRGPFFYSNNLPGHQFHYPSPSYRGGARRYSHTNYRGPEGFHHREVQFPQMGYPMPPQVVVPPVVPLPFMHPPVFPEPFMGVPPYNNGRGPVPPPSLSPPPVDLRTKLLNQINYYFSDENLVKDMYLRSHMDDGGWVPVALIANFNKVRELTQDIQLILETLGASAVVELQGNKIRRRNDWRRWIPILKEPANEIKTILRCLQNATLEEVHAADRSSTSATNANSSPRAVF